MKGCFQKHQHHPFSRRWEHFPKIGSCGKISIAIPDGTTRADFWKMFSSSGKRGGAMVVLMLFPDLYGGLYGYGQNLPYNVKICMLILGIATSKIHIELAICVQIWDLNHDPEQILVQNRPSVSRKRSFGVTTKGATANGQYSSTAASGHEI